MKSVGLSCPGSSDLFIYRLKPGVLFITGFFCHLILENCTLDFSSNQSDDPGMNVLEFNTDEENRITCETLNYVLLISLPLCSLRNVSGIIV